MGTPNRSMSKVTRYVVNEEAQLGTVTDEDFTDILERAIEILRGLERHVRYPTVGEQLDQLLEKEGLTDGSPKQIRDMRGLFVFFMGGLWNHFYFILDEPMSGRMVDGEHPSIVRIRLGYLLDKRRSYNTTAHMVRLGDLIADIHEKHVSFESVLMTLGESLANHRETMHRREIHVSARETAIYSLAERLRNVKPEPPADA